MTETQTNEPGHAPPDYVAPDPVPEPEPADEPSHEPVVLPDEEESDDATT